MTERYELKLTKITWNQLLAVFRTFVNSIPTSNEDVTNIICQLLALDVLDTTPETVALVSNENRRGATERFREIMSKVERQHSLDNENKAAEKAFDTLINLKGLEKFSEGIRNFLVRELEEKIIIGTQGTLFSKSSVEPAVPLALETTSKSKRPINPAGAIDMGVQVRIIFNGTEITNEAPRDCNLILDRSLHNLTGVFYDEGTNIRLLAKFISKEILARDLVSELMDGNIKNGVKWGQKFWAHLCNNPWVADCLHLLCNLNDPDLRNYKMHFRRIFREVEGVALINENVAN